MKVAPITIILTTLIAAALPLCAAALPGPYITAEKTRRDTVKIRWRIPHRTARNATALELHRRAAKEESFRVVAQVSSPTRTGSRIDAPYDDGRYTYKARVKTAAGYSKWSTRVGLRIRPSRHTPPKTPLAEGERNCERGYLSQVLELVNQARTADGREPLTAHNQLRWSAREHALEMARTGNFSHDGWLEFIRAAGFRNSYVGENIAFGYSNPSSVMNGWLNSTGHRNNILNSRFRYLGVGCIVGGGRIWWVQNFGG